MSWTVHLGWFAKICIPDIGVDSNTSMTDSCALGLYDKAYLSWWQGVACGTGKGKQEDRSLWDAHLPALGIGAHGEEQ